MPRGGGKRSILPSLGLRPSRAPSTGGEGGGGEEEERTRVLAAQEGCGEVRHGLVLIGRAGLNETVGINVRQTSLVLAVATGACNSRVAANSY